MIVRGISIHLTDHCNNSCRFCVVESHPEQKERVDRKLLYQFLKDNAGRGYEAVNIHGGEPTIVADFLDILDKIRELGYPTVNLQTNARRLSDIGFAREVAMRGVDLFVVSIHGKDAETHDYLTNREGSFEEAVQGIRNVKILGRMVRTNTVVCKQNHPMLPEIVKFVVDLGVDHVNISNIHPTGRAFKNFRSVTPRLTGFLPDLVKAVDVAVAGGRVVTLEGFPACVLGEYAKYMIGWGDIWWKLLFRDTILPNYSDWMERETKAQGPPCEHCVRRDKCGGVYNEYLEFYGWSEFAPIPA